MSQIFNHPVNVVIAGMSNSGKTQCSLKILQNKYELIGGCPQGQTILFHSGGLQADYAKLRDAGQLVAYSSPLTRQHLDKLKDCIIILDDVACAGDLELKELFDLHSHHKGITAIYICHDLFNQNFRKCRGSVQCYILTACRKNVSPASFLSREIFPYQKSFLARCLSRLLESGNFNYLLVNLQCVFDERFRVQSGLFAPHHRRVLSSSIDDKNIREGLLLKNSYPVNNYPSTTRSGNVVNNFNPSFNPSQLTDSKPVLNSQINSVNNQPFQQFTASVDSNMQGDNNLGDSEQLNSNTSHSFPPGGGGRPLQRLTNEQLNGGSGVSSIPQHPTDNQENPEDNKMEIDQPNSISKSNSFDDGDEEDMRMNVDSKLSSSHTSIPERDDRPRLQPGLVPSVRARLRENTDLSEIPNSRETAGLDKNKFTVDYGNDITKYDTEKLPFNIPGYIPPENLPILQPRPVQNKHPILPGLGTNDESFVGADNLGGPYSIDDSSDLGDRRVNWSSDSVNSYASDTRRKSKKQFGQDTEQKLSQDRSKGGIALKNGGNSSTNSDLTNRQANWNVLPNNSSSSSSSDLGNRQVDWDRSSMSEYGPQHDNKINFGNDVYSTDPKSSVSPPRPQDKWHNLGAIRNSSLENSSFTLPSLPTLFTPSPKTGNKRNLQEELPLTGVKRKRKRSKFRKLRQLKVAKKRKFSSDDERFWN